MVIKNKWEGNLNDAQIFIVPITVFKDTFPQYLIDNQWNITIKVR